MTYKKTIIISFIALIMFFVWFGGFIIFNHVVFKYTQKSPENKISNGIVALTGGRNRIGTAINLLNQGLGQRLLISGVQSQTTVKDIISREDVKLISTNPIELGYTATDTVGNAKEVRDWVNKHNLKSIHVVTSFYHVPRSRLELEKELPSIEVNFISVPSEYVSSKWWSKIRSFCFVAKEYTKFLIVYIQYKMLGL